MKKRISLLLSMALAMMLVMGLSVTAFAAQYDWPEDAPEPSHSCADANDDDDDFIIYVYSYNAETSKYMFLLYGAKSLEHAEVTVKSASNVAALFADEIIVGRFYHSIDEGLTYFCPDNAPASAPESSSTPAHVHSFSWQTITEPTEYADGLEAEVCSCGAVRNKQPLSAYVYALNDYATPMMNIAKSGQTITFEFGEWNSFPKSFMEKLAEKSGQNVTFVFHYKWNHVKQEITIPAGTPIDLNFDWYGPAKMAELYGMN